MFVFFRLKALAALLAFAAVACDGSHASTDAGVSTAGQAVTAGKSASNDTREVTIRWKPRVGDRDFSCTEKYDDLGSTHVRGAPADFRFYVQDLALIDASGREVAVDIRERSPWQAQGTALLDFEDQNGSCGQGTPETNDTIVGTVAAGEYHGVAFTNGVPEALNHQDPIRNPAPLQVTDLTWGWLTGFKFFVAELHASGDDSAGIGLLHLGSKSCTGDPKTKATCRLPNRNRVRLEDFDPDADVIVADIAGVFSATDLSDDNQCHSAGNGCEAMFKHVGVDWETGESLPEQSVYRVEHREGGD